MQLIALLNMPLFSYLVPSSGLNFRDSISFITLGSNKMLRISGLATISCILLSSSAVGWLGLVELLTDMSAPPVGDLVYRVSDITGFIVGGGVLLACLTSDSEFSSTILLWGTGLLGVVALSCLSARPEKCSPKQ